MNKSERIEQNFKYRFKPVCSCCGAQDIEVVLCSSCFNSRTRLLDARERHQEDDHPIPVPKPDHPLPDWDPDDDDEEKLIVCSQENQQE